MKEKGKTYWRFADQFGVSETQTGDIFKKKRDILDALENKEVFAGPKADKYIREESNRNSYGIIFTTLSVHTKHVLLLMCG